MNQTPETDVTQIEARMKCHLGSQVRHLRLVVRDNGLVLQGRARSYYAKQAAQHAAMEMTGLPVVANEIEVC
jgi:osmotically-inducible protein OsmY